MTVSSLETLPAEVLYNIVDLLVPWEVKYLSRASKQLREACLPTLFKCVKFQFSKAGFDGLQELKESAARYHVVSFTYEVPELLKTEILDFGSFKSDLLTPNDYVEAAKDLYDVSGEADECPAYMVIYESLYSICEEQRNLVDNGVDLQVLSSTFGALPRLAELCLSFCETIQEEDWVLSTFASDMTLAEDSHEYHVRVILDALQSARNGGVAIHTVSLMGLNLLYHHTWEAPDLSSLTESLRKLLEPIQVLRLRHSNSSLELLSQCTLDLHRLDMCHVFTEYNALGDFLDINKKTICSIGFHEVKIRGHLERGLSELSSITLCKMLGVPQSTPCRVADCGCLLYRKEGQRLLLYNGHLQHAGH